MDAAGGGTRVAFHLRIMHGSTMNAGPLLLVLLAILLPRTLFQSAEGSIAGVVIVSDTGAPLPDVQVVLRRGASTNSTSSEEVMVLTDGSGRFMFDKLVPDRCTVRAEASGYRQAG